nr:hypothetical protein [Tanacetum cinerariifolium]
MKALIEDENAMDKGVVDTGKKTKKRRIKESESSKKPSTSKETSKNKASSKSSKTGKSVTTKKPIKKPIVKVLIDDLKTNSNEDVVNDVDHPQDDVAPKNNKPSRDTWFKQPPMPPTPGPEWNKRQVVTDQVKQPWFNRMKIFGVKNVSVKKMHGYGHLEEVVVKRADRQLYKFKEDAGKNDHLKSGTIGWCSRTRDRLQTDDSYCKINVKRTIKDKGLRLEMEEHV